MYQNGPGLPTRRKADCYWQIWPDAFYLEISNGKLAGFAEQECFLYSIVQDFSSASTSSGKNFRPPDRHQGKRLFSSRVQTSILTNIFGKISADEKQVATQIIFSH